MKLIKRKDEKKMQYIEKERKVLSKYLENQKELLGKEKYMAYVIHLMKNSRQTLLFKYKMYTTPEDSENQKYLLWRVDYENRHAKLCEYYGMPARYVTYNDILNDVKYEYRLFKTGYLEIYKNLVVY